jgi:hypothetical protein
MSNLLILSEVVVREAKDSVESRDPAFLNLRLALLGVLPEQSGAS